MPPLDRLRMAADPAYDAALDRLLSLCETLDMPDAARMALSRLASADAATRIATARAALVDAPETETLGEHVFVAAALQVHFARLAAGLDAARLVAVGDGVCPVCGGPPVSSMVVGWQGAHGTRFCSCALCGTLWNYVRIKCAVCGSTAGIAYEEVEGGPGTVKAETCDSCRSHAKICSSIRTRRSTRSQTTSHRSRLICSCAKAAIGGAGSIRSCSAIEGRLMTRESLLRRLPSVDDVLKTKAAAAAVDRFGRPPVVNAVRAALDAVRSAVRADRTVDLGARLDADDVAASALAHLDRDTRPSVAAGIQSDRHGAAHQSGARAARRSRGRGGGHGDAAGDRARVRSRHRPARRARHAGAGPAVRTERGGGCDRRQQ